METSEALALVRSICQALPETTERPSHGSQSFFIGAKKCYVMFLENHHGDGRLAIWCAAPLGMQETLIDHDPEVYFRPPYVGHRGWLGVRLDRKLPPDQIEDRIRDAYRTTAPAKLARLI